MEDRSRKIGEKNGDTENTKILGENRISLAPPSWLWLIKYRLTIF